MCVRESAVCMHMCVYACLYVWISCPCVYMWRPEEDHWCFALLLSTLFPEHGVFC